LPATPRKDNKGQARFSLTSRGGAHVPRKPNTTLFLPGTSIIQGKRPNPGGPMARPHPGMHVLCPVCEGPIPDLLGERTDEPAGINAGTRPTDCYSCETPLL